ncbi:two-component system, response regulator, stage 0 sporulation protein F [Candidatus Kryptobacter tengchongensis]|uniref:Two-component system, response regulator, stage 0 sporulation protein F n=2 Tax=Kryptobacter tengchongensis TaxID=1643429 RepID=A0A916LIS9_KRYT1|nr:response regulator [Candidatus Kryptobacter tengchongensis]CUS97306.1 two-component system, response regulator, stage 0 sporulation protein F [Candidatus Kryptobacter tengchongensis]CUU09840.1 two-component system, response regulator, stage 0 sporulation protein F [Candidatus Kryptobacter tengchongensis]
MRKTILLVDDDELVRITLKEFFTLLGLTVIEASNGREGIEKAINNEIHILIADYRMPDLTGVEMIKEIRKFKRDFKIIILTGFANEITNEVIREFGVVAVLQKPVDLGVLEKLITQLLSNPKNKRG